VDELDRQVALITGAGRGQGRSHALTLAAAGADAVVTAVCADIASVPDIAAPTMNPMRVPWLDPQEISNAVLFLASDKRVHLGRDDRGVGGRERAAVTGRTIHRTRPRRSERQGGQACASAPT